MGEPARSPPLPFGGQDSRVDLAVDAWDGHDQLPPEDKEATWRLAKAGELLGVPVQGQLILGDGKYCGFNESGLL